jgi:hypothetical protein
VLAKASLNDPVTTREHTTRGENAIEVAYGLAEAGQYLHSSTDKERQDILNVTESLYTGSKQLFAIDNKPLDYYRSAIEDQLNILLTKGCPQSASSVSDIRSCRDSLDKATNTIYQDIHTLETE